MKRLFLGSFFRVSFLFLLLLTPIVPSGLPSAQAKKFESNISWSNVDKLVEEQKFQAALDQTLKYLKSAQGSGDVRGWTEALIRATQLRIGLHGYETAVLDLKSQAWPGDPTGRVLLNLYYAHALMQYQQMYSWEISSREKTVSAEKVDLKAWTTQQIGFEIGKSFDEVLAKGPGLDQPAPTFFDEYLTKNTYPKGVRPVLRDAVVYLAVRHLANTQFWTPRESAEVYRNDAGKLASMGVKSRLAAANAEKHPLEKIASWLGEHHDFHRRAGRAEAALEAQYVLFETLHSALSEADDRAAIRKALRGVQGQNKNVAWWARGQALLAEFIREENRPGRLIEVREEALAGLKAFPKSEGGQMCASLVHDVERPDYSLMNMSSDGPSKRSLLLTYKNIPKMYFRVYAVDLEAALKSRRDGGNIFAMTELQTKIRQNSPKPILEWSVDLQPTADFAHHRKFITPNLKKPGGYLILASTRPDFSGSGDVVQAARFLVTDVVLTTISRADTSIETRVWSGEKGLPLKDASVSLYRFMWNKVPEVVETKKTGEDGFVAFQSPLATGREYWNYFLIARKDDAMAFELDRIYFGRAAYPVRTMASFVYTDRSIYRPQQKVFWKVAAFEGSPAEGTYKVAAKNTSVSVRLFDPNNQAVETREVKVGEFGTTSGEFTVPTGRPLGAWRVQVIGSHSGVASIRVEEYKRPTFEVKVSEASEAMRLNRKARLKGEAKYYFGLPVTQGSVTWRVTRQEVIPLWWSWGYWGRRLPANDETVASGVSVLKADGSFELEFTPQADERKSSQPGLTYNFNVEAGVTDEGGETRSASRVFRLGFVAVEADLAWSDSFVRSDETTTIAANLRLLDGKPKSGPAKYRVFRLKQPLTASLPAEFPRDEAAGEIVSTEADLSRFATADDRKRARWETVFNWQAISSKWSDGDEVASGDLKHDDKGQAEIKLPALGSAGLYRIQYETQDDFGAAFKFSKNFVVAAKEKSSLAFPILLFAQKTTVEVGGKARLFVHSGLASQQLLIETYRAGQRLTRRVWTAGKDSSFFEIPITKEDRGGLTVAVIGLRDHQFLREEISINVPWTDRALTLEFSTFRDALRPGSKETFRVTVKGSDGKTLAAETAEVLAYMYDRSLDIFGTHAYPSVMSVYPGRFGGPSWNLSLLGQPADYWQGNFNPGPAMPGFNEDALRFHANYGIGGPGRRFKGGFGGIETFGRGGVAPMAAMAPATALQERASARSDLMKQSDASEGAAFAKNESVKDASKAALTGSAENKAPTEIRTNFSETAFFKPHLVTGKDGRVSFEFDVPDSVTSWSVYAHALTKDLRGGSVMKETQSVKDLMVRPYAPRFLREGDEAEIKVSVNNATERPMKGEVVFDIENPETGKSVAALFGLKPKDLKKSFSAAKKASTTLGFPLKAPREVGTYAFRVTASSGAVSDGERRPFPVLPSRMHLAESRFVTLRGKDQKTLEFKDLAKTDDATLLNEKMVVTIDGQLFYGVLQSLPYLVKYPYECVEQTLNRFLSTGIVSSLFAKYPSVAKMAKEMSARKTQFERFDQADANRRMTLEESPWLEASQGGATDAADLSAILDQRVAKEEREKALTRLKKMQLPAGAFPWFEGGPPDEYMTLYVLMGFGRALEFKVDVPKDLVVKAWQYTRKWLDDNIERVMKHDCCWQMITLINYSVSLYPDSSWSGGLFDEAYRKRLADFSFKHWMKHSPLLKGYLALTLQRMNRKTEAKLVWDSVMDSAKTDDQLGTYWAAEDRSWLWYNDTVETHAFSLRALMELQPGDKRSEGLVQWLFLNKKMNHWKSTRATSEAIYALAHYLDDTKTLGVREAVSVDAGTQKAEFVFAPDVYTGKKNQLLIPGEKVSAKNSKIMVEKSTPGFAFASATWHFSTDRLPKEDRGDFFNVSRKYFKRELQSGAGGGKEWTLKPLAEGEKIRVGDQIEVQLSLKTKHEAEYVHLRDPRAAGLEPENVVSGTKWDSGLSWFEEVRDSGANFFFSRLPVGEYTFKYRLRANMAGIFRVGPATIQSLYAPEFNAYSSGYELRVEAAK